MQKRRKDGERFFSVLLGNLLIGILPHYLDISAQWNCGNLVFRFSYPLADDFRAESQGKFEDSNAGFLGDDEMPEFVDEDQDAKYDEEVYDFLYYHDRFSSMSFFVFSLAH